jgi:hypothetical protein
MHRYFPGGFAAARRRLAPLFLLGGLFVVGKLAYEDVPQERELRYVLPAGGEAGAREISAVRVSYQRGDTSYGGLERHFPDGPPGEFSHSPSLPAGRYDLAIELTNRAGEVTRLSRSVQLPSDGPVRVRLTEAR